MDIRNAVAVISGGASGIGEACCRYLLELGARGVSALDLNDERGERLAKELGEKCLFVKTDVSDAGDVEAALAATRTRFGAVHVAIACAGITVPCKLLTKNGPIPLDRFDQVIKVNLYGTLFLIRASVPVMLDNQPNEDGERGVVINVSSGAAYEGQVGQIAYSASKAALVGMTMPLMRELSTHGIRVVTIAPGGFDTPIYETVLPAVKEGIARQFLFPKRLGKAHEFALFVEEVIRNPIHNGRTYRFDSGNILSPTP